MSKPPEIRLACMIKRRPICTMALGLVCAAAPATGQTIRGQVVDEATGYPVLIASIILVDSSGTTTAGAISDSTGRFVLRAPAPGTYTARADATGFGTLVSPPVTLEVTETIEMELRVSHRAAQLESVMVTGDSTPFAPGPLRGFWERKRRGFGQFLTREEIEASGTPHLTTLLSMVPGVRVVKNPRRNPFYASTEYTVRIARSQLHGSSSRGCPPVLYLDNINLGSIDNVSDGFLSPHVLEAVEVYRVSELPAEFSGTEAMCGVIVAWTRRSP